MKKVYDPVNVRLIPDHVIARGFFDFFARRARERNLVFVSEPIAKESALFGTTRTTIGRFRHRDFVKNTKFVTTRPVFTLTIDN